MNTSGPDLAQLQQLCDAATPGPWTAITDNRRKTGIGIVGATADRGTGQAIAVFASTNGHRNADAQLTAAARTALPELMALAATLQQQQADSSGRLARIAEAHHKHIDTHGGTWGECNECGCQWPCPTWTWATTDRDALNTWDPADQETAL